jgi:hypothetical protein
MALSPEIINAIIGVIGTALVGYFWFYITTHRGNNVVLRKLRETSLLKISNLISDNLSIRYKDKPVGKLKLYEFELSNEGYIDIKNLEVIIEIEANEKAGLLEVLVDDAQGKTDVVDVSNGEYYYLIKRPFLNMKRRNKEEKILVQIFSDSELQINITGSDLGWGTVYKEKKSDTPMYIIMGVIAFIVVILSLLSLFAVIKNKVYVENAQLIEISMSLMTVVLIVTLIIEGILQKNRMN